jgi:cephalosporin hydroxylase
MNDLEKYFINNQKRPINKWKHYFDIYERHFNRFRNRNVVVLEIGVAQGGSLQMWKNYFGSEAKIFGMDIEPRCKEYEEDQIKIFIGSQEDRKFLRELKTLMPPIDILIDDGGHTMQQQIITFEELYPHVTADGVYLCEDVSTSYWGDYGGGHKMPGTFIEYSKNLIDYLNAYHSWQYSLKVNEFTKTANSITFYDSVVVIEKRLRDKAPETEVSKGNSTDLATSSYIPAPKDNLFKMKAAVLFFVNRCLRFVGIKKPVWFVFRK